MGWLAVARFAGLAAGVILVGLLAVSVEAQEAGAGAERSLEEIHAAFLEDEDLQLEWPEPEPEEAQEPPPGWLEAVFRFLGNVFGFIGPLLRLAFYLALALGVVSIVYFVGRSLWEKRFPSLRRKSDTEHVDSVAEAPYRPDAAVARSLLEEADALAAAGQFAEAVHLLLFRSIEDIQTRREGGVPQSLTAREIARLDALPDRARTGLAPIIELVERSFFGGRSVDAGGWTSARQSYEAFAFGEAWA
ncbi:MAG: DUF4129 domain-containing protein [Pseudomonadota bacterium]